MVGFDLTVHPFSTSGSFLKIAVAGGKSKRLMIATSREVPYIDLATAQPPQDYYEIALLVNGSEVPYRYEATPWSLTLRGESCTVRFAFADADTISFEARGCSVRLHPCHSCATFVRYSDRECGMGDYRGQCTHQMMVMQGTVLAAEPSPTVSGSTGPYRDTGYRVTFSGPDGVRGLLRFSRYDTLLPRVVPSIDKTIRAERLRWDGWRDRMPDVPARYVETAEFAWYLLYSLTVPKDGMLSRRTVLMSKGWMNKVWAWDNCFNALALCSADKELAFDQLRVYFDNQAPTGKFPDTTTGNRADYVFLKPPIYGWTMIHLIRRLGRKTMLPFVKEAYEPVSALTRWWFGFRDRNRNGMAEYYHGNDSGWDNATVFDQGYPVEGADLAAHLVLQTEALSVMAAMLGKQKDAASWAALSKRQLRALLKKGVANGRFFSPLAGHSDAEPCLSLLNYIPMELGSRLPVSIRTALSADLSPGGPFMTEFGLATEAPASKKYAEDGYWRGPIWAPSTYLIFDGLVDAGEKDLASIVAHRFCDLCMKSPGMWENFEARTGKGLQCPGYSWTAAVFLLLAEWLERN